MHVVRGTYLNHGYLDATNLLCGPFENYFILHLHPHSLKAISHLFLCASSFVHILILCQIFFFIKYFNIAIAITEEKVLCLCFSMPLKVLISINKYCNTNCSYVYGVLLFSIRERPTSRLGILPIK